MEVVQLLGLQGFWQHQVLRGVGSEGSRRYSALEGHGTSIGQHAPVFLPGERPLPDREAWQATVFSLVQFSSVAQLCPTLCDPMDCSLPGSSVHGIFQARVLDWGAIAFSGHTILEHYISCYPRSQLP